MSINIWKHIGSDGNMRKFILLSMITFTRCCLGAFRQNVTRKP
ncbi:iron-regulated protein, partial [Escherichia coli]